jgi:hypothetical protein
LKNCANTGVLEWAGRMYALYESGGWTPWGRGTGGRGPANTAAHAPPPNTHPDTPQNQGRR